MLEYGSDFHFCNNSYLSKAKIDLPDTRFYADGRHAITHLIQYKNWKRIWMPEYFCYDVINSISNTGIEIVYYKDNPLQEEIDDIHNLPFRPGDVLLRMNYFGLRSFKDNEKIPTEVIEDHSHDLIGKWVNQSNANWCIASLRKTIPLPEGGILWSPKGNQLPPPIKSSRVNNLLTNRRLAAMLLKKLYLEGGKIDKTIFRNLFIQTEESLANLKLSGIAHEALDLYKRFDIDYWYSRKKSNWLQFVNLAKHKYLVLMPEDNEQCNPFSLVFMFESNILRENKRRKLIENDIYPAVLWNIPPDKHEITVDISKKVLSIHCDGRYTEEDMVRIWEIINE